MNIFSKSQQFLQKTTASASIFAVVFSSMFPTLTAFSQANSEGTLTTIPPKVAVATGATLPEKPVESEKNSPADTISNKTASLETATGSVQTATGSIKAESSASSVNISTPENLGKSVIYTVKNAISQMSERVSDTAENIEEIASKAKSTTRMFIASADPEASKTGSTDLSVQIDGPVAAQRSSKIQYSINILNNGPSDAHSSVLAVDIPEDMRNITLSCSGVTGNATCPEKQTFDDNTTKILKTLKNFPAGGSIQLELSVVLPQSTPDSLSFGVKITPPEGVLEINERSNASVKNLAPTTSSTDVLISAITNNSTGFTTPPVVSVYNENTRREEMTFHEGDRVSYTVRYQNNGPAFLTDVPIKMDFRFGNEGTFSLEYEDLSISCQGNNGAVCPEKFNYGYDGELPSNGWLETRDGNAWFQIIHDGYTKVEQMPENSSVDVTFSFVPKKLKYIGANNIWVNNSYLNRDQYCRDFSFSNYFELGTVAIYS